MFCEFAVSDVLAHTEHLVGSPRCVLLQIAQTVDNANFSVGTKYPVFAFSAPARTNGLFCGPKDIVSILRVDHFAHCRNINGAFLWGQPKDAVIFVRICHVIVLKIPPPGAYVGNALAFVERGFAFLQFAVQDLEFFLCAFAFRDVLNGTEQPASLSGYLIVRISRQRTPKLGSDRVHGAYFSTWSDNPKFSNGVHTDINLHIHSAIECFSVLRVDHLANHREVHGTFLRFESKDAIGLVRPDDLTCLKIPLPVANMCDALCFLKSRVALF